MTLTKKQVEPIARDFIYAWWMSACGKLSSLKPNPDIFVQFKRENILERSPEAREWLRVCNYGQYNVDLEIEFVDHIINNIETSLFGVPCMDLKVPYNFYKTPFGSLINQAHLRAHPKEWIPAAEARKIIQTTHQGITAYISRGRLDARPNPQSKSRKLVNRSQVLHLAFRTSTTNGATA